MILFNDEWSWMIVNDPQRRWTRWAALIHVKTLKKLMLQSNLDKMTVLPNINHVIWVILRDFSFFRSTSGLLLMNLECLIWSRVGIYGLIRGLVGHWSANSSKNFIFSVLMRSEVGIHGSLGPINLNWSEIFISISGPVLGQESPRPVLDFANF